MRLIDADAFREKVCGWFHKDSQESNEVDDLAASLIMEIDNAPTVEAAPVVHGKWLDNGERDKNGVTKPFAISCSVCGSSAGTNWHKYCPLCGAKMDL